MEETNLKPMIRYERTPLNLEHDQFRLLKVIPHYSDRIRCTLEIYDRDTCPPYIALSYAWGNVEDLRLICIDDYAIPVTCNLYAKLEPMAMSGLENQPYMWIDQLCIDQLSLEEKNDQVRKMASIFSNALGVVAWLGVGDEESVKAIGFVTSTLFAFRDLFNLKGTLRPDTSEAEVERVRAYAEEHKQESLLVRRLAQRAYWTRVWTIQEFALAQEVVILCGDMALNLGDLELFVRLNIQYGGALFNPVFGFEAHIFTRIDVRGRQRDAQHEEDRLDMAEMATRCADLECMNPRDAIYGLLGLFGDNSTTLMIRIDYAKSPQDVFWEFAAVAKSSSEWAKMMEPGTSQHRRLCILGVRMGVAEGDIPCVCNPGICNRGPLPKLWHWEIEHD